TASTTSSATHLTRPRLAGRGPALPSVPMKPLAVAIAAASLLGGGLAAGLAAADPGPPAEPTLSVATAVEGTASGDFVTGLGFSCDRVHWRLGFNLAVPASVEGRLDRRVARAPERWAVVRRFAPRRLAAGPRAFVLKTYPSGVYRVRL